MTLFLNFAVPFALGTAVSVAGVVDRREVVPPLTRPTIVGVHEIVASPDANAFLAAGRRIDISGQLLDSEPVIAVSTRAVAWAGGWLLFENKGERVVVSKLTRSGPPSYLHTVVPHGGMVDVASNGDRAVLILKTFRNPYSHSVVTIDAERTLFQQNLGNFEHTEITSVSGGFIIATTQRGESNLRKIHIWSLSHEGVPEKIRLLAESPSIAVNLWSAGDRALVLYRAMQTTTLVLVDLQLAGSPVIHLGKAGTDVTVRHVVTIGEKLLLAFSTRTYPAPIEERILTIDPPSGRVDADTKGEPLQASDRIGDVWLIARPWGDLAIASSDPRRVTGSAFQLQERSSGFGALGDSVTSNGVALLRFTQSDGRRFINTFARIDFDGSSVDREPQDLPSFQTAITEIPEGFLFVWFSNGKLYQRRLSPRAGWLDVEPRVLFAAARLEHLDALHLGKGRVLILWTVDASISWVVSTTSEVNLLRVEVRTMSFPEANSFAHVGLSRGDGTNLILLQEGFQCQILCAYPDFSLRGVAVDDSGNPLGPKVALPSASSLAEGVWIESAGAWVIPVLSQRGGGEILQLSRDGALRSTTREPLLESYRGSSFTDLRATSRGWEILVEEPSRRISFHESPTARSMTGLGDVRTPKFAEGDRLFFMLNSNAPFTGVSRTVEGDVSVRANSYQNSNQLVLTVANEGRSAANPYIATDPYTLVTPYETIHNGSAIQLPAIAPGEPLTFFAKANVNIRLRPLLVLSEDIEDIDPRDNLTWLVDTAEIDRRSRTGRP